MFEMIPYRPDNPEISDDEIMGYYDMIVEEGSAGVVFYNKTNYTREDFLNTVKNSGCFFYLVKYAGELTAGLMLDGFQGKVAFGHYYTRKKLWGTPQNVEIHREVVKAVLTIPSENGYLFDVILGVTPVWHDKGNNFSKKLGGVEACTIPYLTYNAAKGVSEPGKIFYFTRDCYEDL